MGSSQKPPYGHVKKSEYFPSPFDSCIYPDLGSFSQKPRRLLDQEKVGENLSSSEQGQGEVFRDVKNELRGLRRRR